MVEIQKLKYASGIEQKDILERKTFLWNRPDKRFAEFGDLLYPQLVTSNGVVNLGNNSKYWEEDGNFMGNLTEKQAKSFYPHRAVSKHLGRVLEEHLKDTGMRIVQEHNANNKFTHYWECLSDRFDRKIKDTHAKVDDVVQVGMLVRNGIGTDVALGIDLFTYRLVCENGAISGGTAAGNIRFVHAGNYEHMRDRFIEAIPIAIFRAKELIDYYQQMVYIKMNQKMAEDIYARLRKSVTVKHFPSNFGIDTDEIKANPDKVSKIVNFKNDHVTLFETFNEFTGDLWLDSKQNRGRSNNRMQFTGVRNANIAVHRALLAQIRQ